MTKLAAQVGVDLRSISAYENGEYRPENENVDRIAKSLSFPRSFFFGADLDEPKPDVASFRALKRMTASQRDMALGAGALALMFNAWIEARFKLPSASLPNLSREADPEAAAEQLRREWGLGELPIKNAVHLLEANGIRVFSLALDVAEVDAFSMWRQQTPFVFLNTSKSAEHSRFDAAHELGHLVLHRHGSPKGQEAEREANAFASAFLMPRSTVFAMSPQFPTVDRLVALKRYWNVSVAALAYRMYSLNILSDWQYRSIAIEIARRGFRKREPDPAPRETSQAVSKVLAALRDEGVTKETIATELDVPVRELELLVFGLLVTGLAPGSLQRTHARTTRPKLRIVK